MFFVHQHIKLLLCASWCRAMWAGKTSPDGSNAASLQGGWGATRTSEGIAEAQCLRSYKLMDFAHSVEITEMKKLLRMTDGWSNNQTA